MTYTQHSPLGGPASETPVTLQASVILTYLADLLESRAHGLQAGKQDLFTLLNYGVEYAASDEVRPVLQICALDPAPLRMLSRLLEAEAGQPTLFTLPVNPDHEVLSAWEAANAALEH